MMPFPFVPHYMKRRKATISTIRNSHITWACGYHLGTNWGICAIDAFYPCNGSGLTLWDYLPLILAGRTTQWGIGQGEDGLVDDADVERALADMDAEFKLNAQETIGQSRSV